jgi:hypothetical protein
MKRVIHVVALAGLMTLVAGGLAGAPAGAATTQVVHMPINLTSINYPMCNLVFDIVAQGTFTSQTFTDQFGNVTIQNEAHVVSTMTNVANGEVVFLENSSRDRFQLNPVLNPNGTFTQSDTLTGIDVRIYTSHSSVLMKDDGLSSITGTWDSQGNLLSVQMIEHGPHQFGGDTTAECDAIASAVG